MGESEQHVIVVLDMDVVQANYQSRNKNDSSPLKTEIVLK